MLQDFKQQPDTLKGSLFHNTEAIQAAKQHFQQSNDELMANELKYKAFFILHNKVAKCLKRSLIIEENKEIIYVNKLILQSCLKNRINCRFYAQ